MEDINTVEVTKESFIWTYEGLHSVKTAVSHPVCIILSLEILLYFNSRTLSYAHWEGLGVYLTVSSLLLSSVSAFPYQILKNL